jgi:hypothetical protein
MVGLSWSFFYPWFLFTILKNEQRISKEMLMMLSIQINSDFYQNDQIHFILMLISFGWVFYHLRDNISVWRDFYEFLRMVRKEYYLLKNSFEKFGLN